MKAAPLVAVVRPVGVGNLAPIGCWSHRRLPFCDADFGCPGAASLLRRRICISSRQALISDVRCWGKKTESGSVSVRAGPPLSLCSDWIRGNAPNMYTCFSGEPERRNPSVVMQALKQGFARRLLRKTREARFSTGRSMDFGVRRGSSGSVGLAKYPRH